MLCGTSVQTLPFSRPQPPSVHSVLPPRWHPRPLLTRIVCACLHSLGGRSSPGCAQDRQGQLVGLSAGPGGTGTHAHGGLLFQPVEGQAGTGLLPILLPPLCGWHSPRAHFADGAVDTGTQTLTRLGIILHVPLLLLIEGKLRSREWQGLS